MRHHRDLHLLALVLAVVLAVLAILGSLARSAWLWLVG